MAKQESAPILIPYPEGVVVLAIVGSDMLAVPSIKSTDRHDHRLAHARAEHSAGEERLAGLETMEQKCILFLGEGTRCQIGFPFRQIRPSGL